MAKEAQTYRAVLRRGELRGPSRGVGRRERRTPAATLGQYNEEVLGGLLGLSKSELDRLARDSVIGSEALPPAQRKARAMTG